MNAAIPSPPAGLDLGNLASLNLGDEIVILHPTHSGLRVGSNVYVVHALQSWGVQIRRPDRSTVGGFWYHKDGGGSRGMYGPHYYHSANLAHIAQAKANAEAIRTEETRKKAAREALMTIARPIGEALGDGWNESDNYEESAANALADKLTVEQIKTLAGWLGVG